MRALRSKDALQPQDELSAAEAPREDSRQDSGYGHGVQPPTQKGGSVTTQSRSVCNLVGDAIDNGKPHPKPHPKAVYIQKLVNQSINTCIPIASSVSNIVPDNCRENQPCTDMA